MSLALLALAATACTPDDLGQLIQFESDAVCANIMTPENPDARVTMWVEADGPPTMFSSGSAEVQVESHPDHEGADFSFGDMVCNGETLGPIRVDLPRGIPISFECKFAVIADFPMESPDNCLHLGAKAHIEVGVDGTYELSAGIE